MFFLSLILWHAGWAAMTSLVSLWLHPEHYGLAFSILSTSSRAGDVLSKVVLGRLAAKGYGWRSLFHIAATTQAIASLLNFFILSPDPPRSPASSPRVREETAEKRPHPLEKATPGQAVANVLSNDRFWAIVVAVAALHVVMEFDKYLPLYLHKSLAVAPGPAAQAAALYPLSQLIALACAGFFYDRLSARSVTRGRGSGSGILRMATNREDRTGTP
jgi:sugar phosphate permease